MLPVDSDDRHKLYAMKKEEDWSFLKEKYESIYRGAGVFSNICALAKSLECKAILVEEDYVDYDYRDEFAHFYSTVFTSYSNLCIRLHFFKDNIAYLKELRDTNKKIDYLGYTVIRPIEVGKVGRTIFRPWVHSPNNDYHLCVSSYSSHIFGKEFEIIGTPFIQQDTMVMRCAQASIWMATRTLSQSYRFLPRCLPYEITDAATRYPSWLGKPMPSSGLNLELMVNSLTKLGYPPLVYSKSQFSEEDWDPIDIIYKYIESQVPVIAVVPNHAITIIGHTFDPHPNISKKVKQKRIISSKEWLDSFIIHDDALGPYRLLPVSDEARKRFVGSSREHLLPPNNCLYHTTNDVQHIIIPLPFKVYFPGISIDPHVEWAIKNKLFLTYVLQSAKKGNIISKEFLDCLTGSEQSPLVLRTYFIPSEKYKANLKRPPISNEMSSRLRDEYVSMRMPHFVWITEITTADRLSQEDEGKRTVLGEIIIDCTGNRYGLALLAVHLPGVLITHNPYSGKWKTIDLPDDQPYHHPSRKLRS